MLTPIGDILNWTVAGILFPLMFLPLATLAESRRAGTLPGALIWGGMVAAVVGAALLFARLAPDIALAVDTRRALILFGLIASLALVIAFVGGPTKATRALAPVCESVVRGAGRLVMWFVLALGLVQFAVVILRYVFGLNFIFMQESVTYMHGAVFLLAGGYALLTDDHVRVDIFYRGASPNRKALIDLLGTYLLLFPTCLVILWTASGYVGQSWLAHEGSAEQSGVQGVFLLKSLIPAFAILVMLAGFVVSARAAARLRGED